MMTPAQWIETFKPTSGAYVWQAAYAVVVTEAKALLAALPAEASLTSAELVEKLFPETLAKGNGVDVRQHIFAVLRTLVRRHSFDGWVDTSETKRQYGKDRAVYKWHRNGETPKGREITCPVCDHKFRAGDLT